MSKRTAISLFACAGFGDIGLRNQGFETLVMNEIDEDRAQIAQLNLPEAKVIAGDIYDKLDDILNVSKQKLGNDRLTLLLATPPCQGMSKNGIGTILKAMRDGKRPSIDPRNYLFQPTLLAIEKLNPKIHIFENVDRLMNTYVIIDGESVLVTDHIIKEMKKIGYTGTFRILDAVDYGVPQFRKRTIGIFLNDKDFPNVKITDLYPKPTHGRVGNMHLAEYTTLEDAIGHLPALDSRNKDTAKSDFHPLHKVPVSREDLYYWIENTPEGKSAFENNTCPNCGDLNETNEINCASCHTLLPKPVVVDKKHGEVRKIRGFVSAYKRMNYNRPSHTVTTRSAYAGSDSNLHPTQNRVLSIYEAAILQGLDPNKFVWGPLKGKELANDMVLRDIIGEAVPVGLIEAVVSHICDLTDC